MPRRDPKSVRHDVEYVAVREPHPMPLLDLPSAFDVYKSRGVTIQWTELDNSSIVYIQPVRDKKNKN